MDKELTSFLLESLEPYSPIPEEELLGIGGKLRRRRIEREGYYLRQGDSAKMVGLIYSGLFRIYCVDISGREKTLSFRKKGQFIAGYSPFIENREIWYSIQALEDSEIIYVTFDDYAELEKGHSCWKEIIKNYITALYIEKEDRERSFLMDDATTRYLRFTETYPEYTGKISQYHIASYLGITAESLSRIRTYLKKRLILS